MIIICNEYGYGSLIIELTILNKDIDVEEAIKSACKEYLATDEGKQVYAENSNCFNWGDFSDYVPNEICRKHGFLIVDSKTADMVVDLNDQLIDQ